MSVFILPGITPSQDEGVEPTDDDLAAIEYEELFGEAMVAEVHFSFWTGKGHTRCEFGCVVDDIHDQCPHGYKSLVKEWRIY